MKAPAFQFYPKDFLSSPDVQMMTTTEIGAYCLLLFNSWIMTENPGFLPNNDKKLQRLSKLSVEDWHSVKDVVLEKFSTSECGQFLYNKRLVDEAEKQELRRKRLAENGQKGGRPPKPKDNQLDLDDKPNNNLQVNLDEPNEKQNKRLSSASASTLKENNKESFLEVFDVFRKNYPGVKRGKATEFENFCKKHDNWEELLPLLMPSLENLINHREAKEAAKEFVPEWPHLSTFINQKRWETEVPHVQTPPPAEDKQITAFATLEELYDYWGRKAEFKSEQ